MLMDWTESTGPLRFLQFDLFHYTSYKKQEMRSAQSINRQVGWNTDQ
jgi:hypothetical protein